ncbi:glycosyltransferase [Melaminivora sp.]|uniref:glycosyltransferase n=1 Tax=Melaminivora sp. TaxID=1933032 RepID=UPI0028A91CB9|nr:glycosyltransferase [Melaminivora sp.]
MIAEEALPKLGEKPPKVSVCVVTYNQEKYITQCLQSIVDQQTDFEFEIIVGDDCSTDGTKKIIQRFAKEYPNLIRPIFNSENLGAFQNYFSVHRAARGTYVAHVDGDDWTRPEKLQIQSDYLDAHGQASLAAHRMRVWEKEMEVRSTAVNPGVISIDYLLRRHPIFMNSSIMYRRLLFLDLFEKGKPMIDYYLYIYAATKGAIGFLNDILGDYRSNIGISSKRDLMPYIQEAIDLAECEFGNSQAVRRARAKAYLSYAVANLLQGNNAKFYELNKAASSADFWWMRPRIIRLFGTNPQALKRMVHMYKKAKW